MWSQYLEDCGTIFKGIFGVYFYKDSDNCFVSIDYDCHMGYSM